jgi:hypothetical protein
MRVRIILLVIVIATLVYMAWEILRGPGSQRRRTFHSLRGVVCTPSRAGLPRLPSAGPKPSAVKTRTIRTIRGSTGAEINTPDPPLIESPRLVPLYPPEIDTPRPLFFHPTFVATGTVLFTPEAEDAPSP